MSLKCQQVYRRDAPIHVRTDHQSFEAENVPGFACAGPDEYRLTHHTQSDTFDKAKEPNLIRAPQVMAVTAMRLAICRTFCRESSRGPSADSASVECRRRKG